MKQCSKCGEVKAPEKFHRMASSKDGRKAQCKECIQVSTKGHYERNKDEILERNRKIYYANKEKISQRRKQKYQENIIKNREHKRNQYYKFKEKHLARVELRYKEKREIIDSFKDFCKICGDDRNPVLVFHHLNPKLKLFTITAGWMFSDEKLLKEISKCIVLCSNCHREFHFYQKHPEEMTNENYNKYVKTGLILEVVVA